MLDLKQALMFGVLISSIAIGPLNAHAADLEPSTIRAQTQRNPVTILQNRYFLKAFRPELGLALGKVTNDAYTETQLQGARAALFLNEWLGFEVQSLTAKVKDSDDKIALNQISYKNATGDTVVVDPEVNKINDIKDFNGIFAPFYGKINFSDWLIIYTDVYLTAGMAKVETEQGTLDALTYGVGQRLYWQKNLSMRVDFRSRNYTEKRNGTDYKKKTNSVDFGLSYFLL